MPSEEKSEHTHRGGEEGTPYSGPGDIVIRHIGCLVPMADTKGKEVSSSSGLRRVIKDGAVVAENGVITFVGEDKDLTSGDTRGCLVLDGSNLTVVPGFVDSHTHLAFSGDRAFELEMKLQGYSYLEILKKGGGILSTVRALRRCELNQLVEEMRNRTERMLEYGTCTVEVKSGYGLDIENEVKILEGVKVLSAVSPLDIHSTFMGAHAVPPEFQGEEEYVDYVVERMLPEVEKRGLAEFVDVFCEKGVFSAESSERILREGAARGMKPKIHIDEIESIGGADVAVSVGAISAEHLVKTSLADAEKLARAGVVGVVLPGTPFSLMSSEYAPVRDFMKVGMEVAVATDCNPNCYTESMPFVISLACYMMKMTPYEALKSATINGAKALGVDENTGSLEVGKKADMVMIEYPSYEHIPYRFGVNPVICTVKNGSIAYLREKDLFGEIF